MQCTRNVKFCGFKFSKKSKKGKKQTNENYTVHSQETNSSSGIISDLSDRSQIYRQLNNCSVQSNLPWINTGRNSINSFINPYESKSSFVALPNDMMSPGCSKNLNKKTSKILVTSTESIHPVSIHSNHQTSNSTISSSQPFIFSQTCPNDDDHDKQSLFSFLQVDILSHILRLLPVNDLCSCARVCKQWYSVVWNQNMWYKLDFSQCHNDSGINIHKGIDTILKILSYRTPPFCYCLKVIDLSKCQITDDDLIKIANKCPELEVINLTLNIHLQNASVCHLIITCRRIHTLNLSKCIQINELKLIQSQIQYSPIFPRNTVDNLKHLDLSYCRQIDDSCIHSFSPVFNRLRKLILKECRMITDGGMKCLAKYGLHLKYLDIAGCCFVTDKGISSVIMNLHCLRRLSISKCHKITNNSIQAISTSNNQICEIILRNCSSITFSSLKLLRNLRIIDLSDNCQISRQSIFQIAENNRYSLKILIINKFDNISREFLRELFQMCVRLKYIDIKNCKFIDPTPLRRHIVYKSVLKSE